MRKRLRSTKKAGARTHTLDFADAVDATFRSFLPGLNFCRVG